MQNILQGLQSGISAELENMTNRFFDTVKKRMFSVILQIVVFSASAIFLLLGFILLAANFMALEYVLLLFGFALLLGFLIGTK